jgi:hypothetical protein
MAAMDASAGFSATPTGIFSCIIFGDIPFV